MQSCCTRSVLTLPLWSHTRCACLGFTNCHDPQLSFHAAPNAWVRRWRHSESLEATPKPTEPSKEVAVLVIAFFVRGCFSRAAADAAHRPLCLPA